MACKCVMCPECKGTGNVWYANYGRGEYLGSSRCDDCDELEECDFCEGSGIIEQCDECLDAELLDDDDWD